MRKILAAAVCAVCSIYAWGQNEGRIVFGDELTDTARVTTMLINELAERPSAEGAQRVVSLGEKLAGAKYKKGVLEGAPERLVVRLDSMDCTSFVETAIALALTADEGRSSWRDFVYNLERVRYRGGKMGDYVSRLHYTTDWAMDMSARGVLSEVTDRVGSASYQVKTLDYITQHRKEYPALADDDMFERMKNAEIGYRSHRMPYIKAMNVKDARLKDGDIVAMTTNTPGLDVAHIGVVKMVGGKPHLLHASSVKGSVRVEELPLADYLKRNRKFTGIRVFRLRAE